MEKRYKIAMVSSYNISDRRILSGLMYYMKATLQQYVGEVECIDKLKPEKRSLQDLIANIDFYVLFFLVKMKQLCWKLLAKNYQWERTALIASYYARKIQKRLKGKQYDFIIADKGSIELAYLKRGGIPIIYSSDATFKLMLNFYKEFSHMPLSAIREGNSLEQRAIDNAALCIFHTRWAAQSAIDDYGALREKVSFIYYGPNIEPEFLPTYEEILNKEKGERCNLLLVGIDWERKGCAVAVEATECLNAMGVDVQLIICGCKPPSGVKLSDRVTIIPFLNKNKREDMERLVSLYREATFFVLPTRAECLGGVFIEACAFGLPALSTNVGGTPEVVRQGVNGFTFSVNDRGQQYAKVIAQCFRDPAAYKKMSLNAYEIYRSECNWERWAEKLKELIVRLL